MANVQKTTVNKDREDFIDELHRKGIGTTRLESEFIWKSCCDQALHWMLNKDRPVDMWYIRLHCTMLRTDWTVALYRRLFASAVERQKVGERSRIVRRIMEKVILSPKMVAMDGDIVRRSVEVEYTSMWRRLTRDVETVRLEMLKSKKYALYVLDSLQRNLASNKRRFTKWLAGCSSPSAKVVLSDTKKPIALAQDRAPYPFAVSGCRLTPFFTLVRINDGQKAVLTNGAPKVIPQANVSLPAMPNIPAGAENVRGGGDVSGSGQQPP